MDHPNRPFEMYLAPRGYFGRVSETDAVSNAAGEAALALALISESEFETAQSMLSDLPSYLDYGDYQNERDGAAFGLISAGCDCKLVPVSMSSFKSWANAFSRSVDCESLDAFAQWVMLISETPHKRAIRGVLRGRYGAAPEASSDIIVPVDLAHYRDWRRCLRAQQFRGRRPTLDGYAALLAETWAETASVALTVSTST